MLLRSILTTKEGSNSYADVFSRPAGRRHCRSVSDVPVPNQQNLTESKRPFCVKKGACKTAFLRKAVPERRYDLNSFSSCVCGKKALRNVIVCRFHQGCNGYVEVFGGGGWVLFHKPVKNGKNPQNQSHLRNRTPRVPICMMFISFLCIVGAIFRIKKTRAHRHGSKIH